ncbi:MAG TPA: DNA topoisomerase IB [Burkholderiaceae bacterium]|nr:DNA topoisomerase IB [Burkholderiaceae bacterium]
MRTASRPAPEAPRALVYVSDADPGIRRVRRGAGFAYVRPDGAALRDAGQLQRIRRLAIPPAYGQVWICALPHGHLQATGRDARGRKQYRYHADWRRQRDERKFDRLLEFGAALPRIRRQVAADLAAPIGEQVARRSVVAAIVRLLDTTLMRVGNDEYARSNGSFGLTTLRQRHARVRGAALQLRFRGKSGVVHDVSLEDRRVARVVRQCQALPGQELFRYVDEQGETHGVGSTDVNDYLREASGGDFTAKDFRTWHGSVHALQLWRALDPAEAARPTLAGTKRLLAEVAARLGNSVAVCRKAYVHPKVLALLSGETALNGAEAARPARTRGLAAPELDLLGYLRGHG